MDRTEGKVADIVFTGNMTDMVRALEAGRTRLLELRNPQPSALNSPQAAIEGEVIPQHLVVYSSPVDSVNQPAESIPTKAATSK